MKYARIVQPKDPDHDKKKAKDEEKRKTGIGLVMSRTNKWDELKKMRCDENGDSVDYR